MPKKLFVVSEIEPRQARAFTLDLVVPRPIGWIGSQDDEGIANLAPFSFFNAVSGSPPTVLFSPGYRQGSPKDTLSNVRATGQFTVNIVTAELGEAMNQISASADREVDEFEIAGLTTVRGSIVNAPLVAQCRANLECSVTQIIETGTQPNLSAVVFGEIVAYQVDESVLDDTGRIDSAELDVIGRMGGRSYTYTRDTFELDRPAG